MNFATRKLFDDDAYLKQATAKVVAVDETGFMLDQTVFYATSGGQPGDSGIAKRVDGSEFKIIVAETGTTKAEIWHRLENGAAVPSIGETVEITIDWERRFKLMQMHTACHLLSVICPFPITGAGVSETDSRVDFDMTGQVATKEDVTEKLQAMIAANHPIFTRWIDEAELDANPDIVRSKNVRPPRGLGRIRLVCIGDNAMIDSQPCGGTHVASTSELGVMHIGKIENKGRENRRFRIRFGDNK